MKKLKHQFGEILSEIGSCDGEFYVYGHITDTDQILNCHDAEYPELEGVLEYLHEHKEMYILHHALMRCVPSHPNLDDYVYNLVDAKEKGYGVMPITVVTFKEE